MANYNLFDAASLAMIPVGSKEGTVYSIKPEPVYGSEEVTNGDFATDSDWTKGGGATISGGQANIIGGGGYVSITQNSVFTAGKKYRVSVDVVINSGLGLKFQDGANNENIGFATSSGTYVFDFTAGSNTSFVVGRRAGGTAFNSSVDNVSVKEVLVNGDFTFSRGSNLAATRVGADGLIEKGRENVFLQSNNFDTNWITSNASVTSGQTGYDGTNNAWSLTSIGATGYGNLHQIISFSGVHTISVYAKQGSNDYLTIRTLGDDIIVVFKLDDGTRTTTKGSPVDTFIEDAGGGWYRCGFTANFSSATFVNFYPQSIGVTVAGNILIQSAQLESGLVSTSYITSGATTGTAGILEDTPRLDYSNGASCPSLLLEPSRTNLITYSEYFPSSLTYARSTFLNNDVISPEGVQNATKWLMTSDTGAHYARKGFTTSIIHTFSVFAKKGNYRYLGIRAAGTLIAFDFDTETFVGGTGTKEQLTDGWWRLSVAGTGSGFSYFGCHFSNASGSEQATADGTEYYHLYGTQIEQGSYPTSYIPNHSGGTITRAADICGDAGDANTFNSTEGVLYAEVKYFENTLDSVISISDGGNSNRILIGKKTDNKIQLYVQSTTTQADITTSGTFSLDSYHKFAISYKVNDFKLYIDGVLELSSTSGLVPVGLSQVDFYNPSGSSVFNGKVKQVLTFNTALLDTELAALTLRYENYQEWVTGERLTWESPSCTNNNITELKNL